MAWGRDKSCFFLCRWVSGCTKIIFSPLFCSCIFVEKNQLSAPGWLSFWYSCVLSVCLNVGHNRMSCALFWVTNNPNVSWLRVPSFPSSLEGLWWCWRCVRATGEKRLCHWGHPPSGEERRDIVNEVFTDSAWQCHPSFTSSYSPFARTSQRVILTCRALPCPVCHVPGRTPRC